MARRAETTGRTLSDELHVDDENDNNYKQNKTQMVKKERLKKITIQDKMRISKECPLC